MSNRFWRRLSHLFGYMALLLLFMRMLFVANIEIKDLDLWLHIGMGRYIVQHGFQIPAVDILSCTIAGKEWINHEWLFQVIVYSIYHLQGPEGLITMQVLLVTLTMLILLLLGYNKKKQLASIFILLLVSLVYENRFTIRPDLFSLLFFALYVWVLSFHLDKKWSLFALFLVQVLWTNIHGFFFFGPLFVVIGLAAEWIKRHVPLPYEWNKIGRLTDDEYERLVWILVTVMLACLLNPLTFRGAWYPVSVFFKISQDHQIFFDRIVELKRPLSADTLWAPDKYPYYKLLIIMSFISMVFNRRRLDIGVVAFWLVFLVFSLAAIRNLIFFAFAAYLVFVTNILPLSMRDILPVRVTDRKFGYIVSTILKVGIIIWTLQYWIMISTNGYFDFDSLEFRSEWGGVSRRNFPDKAVDFLVENKVQGNFFNDFNSGAYLVGRCYPDIRVFIDGRTEVYGTKFFQQYIDLWENDNPELFAKALDHYQITGVFLNTVQQPIPIKVLNYMEDSPDWIPVYLNYDGMIYLKDVPQNRAVIERHALDLEHWQAEPMNLYRIATKKVIPYVYVNRAFSLEALGYYDAALSELEAALAVNPFYEKPYSLRGQIRGKRKQYREAYEDFRRALLLNNRDRMNRYNLARALRDMGEYTYALVQYERLLEERPSEARVRFLVAWTLLKMEAYDDAMTVLRKAHEMEPQNRQDIFKMGALLAEEGRYDLAKEVYVMGFDAGKEPDQVFYKLGRVYEREGALEAAQKAWQQGLRINPENADIQAALEGRPEEAADPAAKEGEDEPGDSSSE